MGRHFKFQNDRNKRNPTIKCQEFALSSKSSKVACSDLLRNKVFAVKLFFPRQEHRETQTAKPKEDVWHFHDFSKDYSVATIPEENIDIEIEYIKQRIALCARLKKKKKISAGLKYIICA